MRNIYKKTEELGRDNREPPDREHLYSPGLPGNRVYFSACQVNSSSHVLKVNRQIGHQNSAMVYHRAKTR